MEREKHEGVLGGEQISLDTGKLTKKHHKYNSGMQTCRAQVGAIL